ncbi:MAG: hypothetical protein D3924_08695, partial [Candidatus Electrothrix sp. AR4]|nr:hypothetical protein [Candidatus Electrothrix sp. AR4]
PKIGNGKRHLPGLIFSLNSRGIDELILLSIFYYVILFSMDTSCSRGEIGEKIPATVVGRIDYPESKKKK